MKQARRKDLKTNELSIYLQQIQEAVVRHSNIIIGGIVAVVLILMIGLYYKSSQEQAKNTRAAELSEIRKEAAAGVKPETVERAQRLADQTSGDPALGAAAREEHAELAYQLALNTSPVSNPDEYTKRLQEAQAAYESLIKDYSDQPEVVAKGHLGLGSTYESLHVVGKATLDQAKEQYQLAADSGTYVANVAKPRLATLAERTRPLKIVATLPAESAPAAATTVPAFEVPTTAPAKAPATAPR